jgi:Mg-chelatase subunit ChlD
MKKMFRAINAVVFSVLLVTANVYALPARLDVLFVLDNSGTMKSNDPEFMTRRSVLKLTRAFSQDSRVGVVVFDSKADFAMPLTSLANPDFENAVKNSLRRLSYTGKYTNYPIAIERAVYDLKLHGRKDAEKVVIFMTDGFIDSGNAKKNIGLATWLKEELTLEAKNAGIRIFSLVFTEEADFELIQTLSVKTGGGYYRAGKMEDLEKVFDAIQQAILLPPVKTQSLVEKDGFLMELIGSAFAIIIISGIAVIFLRAKGNKKEINPNSNNQPKLPEAMLPDEESITGKNKILLTKKEIEGLKNNKTQPIVGEPKKISTKKARQETEIKLPFNEKEWSEEESQNQPNKEKAPRQKQERPPQEFTKQIIKSESNREQTEDLRVLFNPNNHFAQEGKYQYPVVIMPKQNSSLKLPRTGRSNQKGYKENDFYSKLKLNIFDIELANNVHMVIPYFNKPYEPDIVLFDKSLNLYIDIEIDEPYDGYYRYPTHYINPKDEVKQDNVRDLFFTESGWIVIRFTEKQVHCQANECIDFIKNVLNSIYNREFNNDIKCEKESQWDYNQCIQWQKTSYRENYLGKDSFQKQNSYKEIEIDAKENESIEGIIKRTKKFNFDNCNSSIAFDEESHKYIHPKDETGNAEYISVTTLIERFFPFDVKRYIERKAVEENRTQKDVLDEYLNIRDEAAEKGTFLHKQIENYLKQTECDSDSKEFKLFLDFYNKEIKERNLIFDVAEKMIFSNKYNVAGTIDCLFKKDNKDEFVMLDWKCSKKLVIKGSGEPNKRGFQIEIFGLTNLNNCSFYRYSLQQNIYKHIVESEYGMKISSMQLVVLHENFSKYYVVTVPELKQETDIILNSLKVKI